MPLKSFLHQVDGECKTQLDRAIALIWFVGHEDHAVGMTAKEIALVLRTVGHPQQNVSRMEKSLRLDKRTASTPGGGWALRPAARKALDSIYAKYLGHRPLPASDSIIPTALLAGTRGYIERVGDQINKSFDGELYDCCAVMCRRLLETLIIEMYEHAGRPEEIKKDGHFLPLADLVTSVENDRNISLSRLGLKALKDFKRLGDLSAHNRRYNARVSDIEPLRDGIRLVAEEMLHIAGLYSSNRDAVAA